VKFCPRCITEIGSANSDPVKWMTGQWGSCHIDKNGANRLSGAEDTRARISNDSPFLPYLEHSARQPTLIVTWPATRKWLIFKTDTACCWCDRRWCSKRCYLLIGNRRAVGHHPQLCRNTDFITKTGTNHRAINLSQVSKSRVTVRVRDKVGVKIAYVWNSGPESYFLQTGCSSVAMHHQTTETSYSSKQCTK